jgi:predicted methyltransferase
MSGTLVGSPRTHNREVGARAPARDPIAALELRGDCGVYTARALPIDPGDLRRPGVLRDSAAVGSHHRDRTARDRERDVHRKPVETLQFFQVAPGMRVAELGAGAGYTTDLLAHAVGPTGTVLAQDTPNWDGADLKKVWEARLAEAALRNTTHVMRQWDDPLPPEASHLDAVYAVAVYHDAIAENASTEKMNAAVFRALKSGGTYAVIDNSAAPGAGASVASSLHRVEESFLRAQVERAGFRFAGGGDFLRNPTDGRDWNADPSANVPGKVHTQDRFALRFVKP